MSGPSASASLAAVWLPDQSRRVLILDIETDEQVLPRIVLSEAAAGRLVDQLLRGLGALQRLPGGCGDTEKSR